MPRSRFPFRQTAPAGLSQSRRVLFHQKHYINVLQKLHISLPVRHIFRIKGGSAVRTVLKTLVLVGMPVSAGVFMILTAAVRYADLPDAVFPMLAELPILCGSALTGSAAARRCRHGGLWLGAVSAVLLTALWMAVSAVLYEIPRTFVVFVASVPVGMLGGVCGVNRPAPAVRKRAHRRLAWRADRNLRAEIRRNLREKRNI